ncbi:carboxypeptidase-like regulatory domain-containing protein [Flavobacteriaceae bacterium S356]|uniref:Carboxypeptidase-like regulatory domain-containing protein n=1 Tax=Asprobacillus argus TaxID=3076534 RepID=A0ABU3LDS3_9FLAO|nr:carboxypeptidase-like regulatory domain-containing protein [Flavobacteriaceae bacterium S356]
MSKKRFLLVLCSSLFFVGSYAQSIKGKVFNEKKAPLSKASIYIKKLQKGVTTNSKGEFKIKIKNKVQANDTLVFSYVGFKARRISLKDLEALNYVVTLESKLLTLDEVSIRSSKKKLKTYLDYSKLAPMEKGLFSFGSVLANNKIYVSGGNLSAKFDAVLNALNLDKYNSRPLTPFSQILQEAGTASTWEHYNDQLYAYNLITGVWEKSALKFIKRAHHNLHYYNGKLMVLGGKTLSKNRRFEYLENKIEEFNITKNRIAIDEANPHKAVNFASFLTGDHLIVLGGSIKKKQNGKKNYENKIHVYNLKTGKWYHVSYMPVPKETTGVLVENTIYLFGGYNGEKLKNIESFNIKDGRWKIEGELFSAVEKPAITNHNGVIYIYAKGRVMTFDIATKELNQYLIDLSIEDANLYCANNKLYILGGFSNRYDRLTPSNDLYSIDIDEFDKTALSKSRTF